MKQTVVALLLVWGLAAPLVHAQEPGDGGPAEVVTDAAGDVRVDAYDNAAPSPAALDAVDLVGLSVTETETELLWTVHVVALAEDRGGGSCADSGDLRSFFQYGAAIYNVQQGLSGTCDPYAFLFELYDEEADFNRRPVAELEVTITEPDQVTAHIPKELVLDDGGTPPIAGRSLTGIRATSYTMFSFGGPDITDPFQGRPRDAVVVTDNMPDAGAEGGTYTILSGGGEHLGDVRLWSDDPFRASNGGAAIFTYTLHAANHGATAATYDLALEGIPDGWNSAAPTSLDLAPGEANTFTVAIETPARHQHGGSDAFAARLTNAVSPEAQWASVDLGIHYLDVPHLAGHHPELYLHGQPLNNPIATAFSGGDGIFTLSTLADDGQPDHAAQAFSSGADGSTLSWIACLGGGLRMGLDWDLDGTGIFAAELETTRPYPGAVLGGRIIHLGTGPTMEFCAPPFYGDRVVTEMAALDPVDLGDWQGAVPVTATITPLVDKVPHEVGSTLVLEIWVEHSVPNLVGDSTARVLSGAKMTLPMEEYVDERPAGIIGGGELAPEATAEQVAQLAGEPEGADEGNEAPGLGIAAILPLLALVAIALMIRQRV